MQRCPKEVVEVRRKKSKRHIDKTIPQEVQKQNEEAKEAKEVK